MNILVIDRAPPCDLLQGNALIGQHLFRRLRHHHLTIICPAPAGAHERYQAELGATVRYHPSGCARAADPGAAWDRSSRRWRGPVCGWAGLDLAASRAFQARVRSVVASGSFDVIHTRQLPMAAITAGIKHPAKLLELIDSGDAASRAARATESAADMAARRCCAPGRASCCAPVRRLHDGCRCRCASCAAAGAWCAGACHAEWCRRGTTFAPLDLPEQPETIIFTGAMSFPPNVTAVLHFYHEHPAADPARAAECAFRDCRP